jgi:cation diffusion facilitator CzcD-associated flavoprotein CzcO
MHARAEIFNLKTFSSRTIQEGDRVACVDRASRIGGTWNEATETDQKVWSGSGNKPVTTFYFSFFFGFPHETTGDVVKT